MITSRREFFSYCSSVGNHDKSCRREKPDDTAGNASVTGAVRRLVGTMRVAEIARADAAVIARTMGHRAEPSPLPDETDGADADRASDWLDGGETPTAPPSPREPLWLKARHDVLDWLGGRPAAPSSGEPAKDERKTKRLDRDKLD